jgi:hypothetical protein
MEATGQAEAPNQLATHLWGASLSVVSSEQRSIPQRKHDDNDRIY